MSRGGMRGGPHAYAAASRGPQLPWSLQQQVGGGGHSGSGSSRGGRGGHSRGGHNRSSNSFGRAGGAGGGGGPPVFSHRPAKRKEQRKAARQEKRHQRLQHQQQHAQQRHAGHQQQQQQKQQQQWQQQQQQLAGRKRAPEVTAHNPNSKKAKLSAPQQQQQQHPRQPHQQQRPLKQRDGSSRGQPHAAAAAPAPRVKGGSSGAGAASKTMFYDLLAQEGVQAPRKGAAAAAAAAAAAGGASGLQAAFLQDLQTERELARKLKIKKGSKLSGPEDGLDHFLSGITQLLPDSLRKQQAAAAAGGSSDGGSASEDEQTHSGAESGSGDLSDPFGFGGDSYSSGSEGLGSDLDGSGSDSEGLGSESEGLGSEGEEGAGFGAADSENDMMSDASDEEDGSLSSEGISQDGQAGLLGDSSSDGGSSSSGDSDGSSSEDDTGSEQEQQQQQVVAAAAVPSAAKYVPPALRRAQEAAAGAGAAGSLSVAVQRRITGLLNRLAEANLQGIVRDILGVYESEGRRAVAEAVSAGLLAAVAEGPRATEQFAAVVAVFVAGLTAAARAQDISARFLEQLAARLEQAYAAADGLACHNLIMLLAYCYSAGLVAADCMYSVLGELTQRFTEADVAMMLSLLNAVGLQLRAADPAAMKEFVLAVHQRAATAGASGGMSKRAEIMLELVMDIKNNRVHQSKASKAAAAATAGKKGRGGAAAVLQPGLLKWLKQQGVDDVTLSNISWAKLVQPNKKGMWWHPSATDAAAGLLPGVLADTLGTSTAAAAAAAAAADADDGVLGTAAGGEEGAVGGSGGAVGAGQLLQLAAGLRMTTDVRRAVFVAIMGSEDCAEACEKLLRLPLKGDQSREVVRVLVECCLQEARYNPYYGHLAARLAAVSKGYKVTLQYCLWDQWKAVTTTEPRRLLCLAGLVGQLLSSCVLPLSSLKPVDFDAAGSWTNKETFLWRHTLQLLLTGFPSDADCEAAFARLAAQQQLGSLAKGLGSFLKLVVGPWVVAQDDAGAFKATQAVDGCLQRLARAEKILLSSTAAVLAG